MKAATARQGGGVARWPRLAAETGAAAAALLSRRSPGAARPRPARGSHGERAAEARVAMATAGGRCHGGAGGERRG